jgi:ribosome assembly protein YihI (activator of Der GTPase)
MSMSNEQVEARERALASVRPIPGTIITERAAERLEPATEQSTLEGQRHAQIVEQNERIIALLESLVTNIDAVTHIGNDGFGRLNV